MTQIKPDAALTSPDRDPGLVPADIYQPVSYMPEQSMGYLMRRIVGSLSHRIDLALTPSGLTSAQWLPLYKVHRCGSISVAELARDCDMDSGAMTRLLDRLEQKGLLQRTRSEQDRRVVKLALTNAGRESVRSIAPVLSQVQNEHLAGFSHEEWAQLMALLQRILRNAQNLAPTAACAASDSSRPLNVGKQP